MAENKKQINEYFRSLPANSSPSSATNLVAEENGVTKKVPIDSFVRQDEDGAVTLPYNLDVEGSLATSDGASFGGSVSIGFGEALHLYNEDNNKAVGLFCSADGTKLELNDAVVATEAYVDEKVANISGGGFPELTIVIDEETPLVTLTRAFESAGMTSSERKRLVQLQGIGYALLLCNAFFVGNSWVIYATNLYNGKKFEAKSVDPRNIRLRDFLDPTGEYVVEDSVEIPDEYVTETKLEERLAELGDLSGGSNTYIYEMQDSSATMLDLINYIESQGYISDTIMLLQLAGAKPGKYIGSINFFASRGMFTFNLLDVNTATLYSAPTSSTSTTIVSAFAIATKTELDNSRVSGLPYESVYWGNPMTDMLDKITEYVSPNSPQKTIIQIYGYNSALLLASGNLYTEDDKDIWSLSVTNLYNGKMLYVEDVDPATITISDFLNSGKYEVKQESGGSPMTYITYNELKDLRNSGSLVPGMFYRITDYQCTTSQENTGAMNNQFDIIVQALDESTLSETASADKHENDTYFADTNFGAWEIKYCLDNDSSRFAWAIDKKYSLKNKEANFPYFVEGDIFTRCESMDGNCSREGYVYAWTTEEHKESWEAEKCIYTDTEDVLTATNFAYYSNYSWMLYSPFEACFDIICESGKGVIYYMKDEFGNECPYDFKNITYTNIRSSHTLGLDTSAYYPTFTLTSLLSYTQWGSTYGVTRASSLDTMVNGVLYYGYTCSSNPSAWGTNVFFVTDEVITSSSTMYFVRDGEVSVASFGGSLGSESNYETSIKGKAKNNIIREYTESGRAALPQIVISNKSTNNIFGRDCMSITLNSSDDNTFAKGCGYITIISGSYNNFDAGCSDISLQNGCYDNKFGASCAVIDIGEGGSYNTFGVCCSGITIGHNCTNNTFEGTNNEFNLGEGCSGNTFGRNCSSIILANNCYGNTIEPECAGIYIEVESTYYVRVCQGINHKAISPVANANYQQVFKAKGSTETEV